MKFSQKVARYFGFVRPSALEQAATELEDAKRGLLAAAEQREYYAAIEGMMIERAARLRATIEDLTQEGTP